MKKRLRRSVHPGVVGRSGTDLDAEMQVRITTELLLPDDENLDAVMERVRRALRRYLPKLEKAVGGRWLGGRGTIFIDRRDVALVGMRDRRPRRRR